MGCIHTKYKDSEKELVTIDQQEDELFRFQKNVRGYRRRKTNCLKRIKSAKSQTKAQATPSSRRSKADEPQKDESPSCDQNVPNIKQDFDVPQREPANASSSHSVVMMHSQKSVQHIPEDQEIFQCYNPIQNYVFMKRIGAGGFGQVYLAEHKFQDGQFAIKTIPLELSQTTNSASEVEILRNCEHKNILSFQESFQCNDNLYIVTEYIHGNNLYTINTMARGYLINESLVSYVMRECLQGLAYLHRQKIIHCDLKSANILVGMNGQVKIADFGLSEREDELIIPGFRGTTWYAAPEMANGLPFDGKVDIWGLGIVAIEMVQGYAPLACAPTKEEAFNLAKYGYNAMSEGAASMASANFMDFLYNGALIRNPKDRLTANELLQHPFITSLLHVCDSNCMCVSTLLDWVMMQQGGNG